VFFLGEAEMRYVMSYEFIAWQLLIVLRFGQVSGVILPAMNGIVLDRIPGCSLDRITGYTG
jgi:hypothetical protein